MTEESPRVRDGSGPMFDAIAGRYDLLNRLISLGIDRRWRTKTVRSMALSPGARVLDLATGTADLAIEVAHQVSDSTIVGVDPSEKMLAVGLSKLMSHGLDQRVTLMPGRAETLPFSDKEFDGICMGFGIRNVPERSQALREMARVTKSTGRIAILELSEPRAGLLAPFARLHVHRVVPWVGGLLSGSREYRYLQQSIAAFPPPEHFAALMTDAGLEVLEVRPLTFGVAHLYLARPRSQP